MFRAPPPTPSNDIQLVSNCFGELTEGWWTIILSPLSGVYSPGTSECHAMGGRLRLKCGGTHAETRLRLSTKWTSPFTSAEESVQSTTGSRGVRISGINAGYTMFRGSVKSTGYPLHSPVTPSLPLQCVTVCHHISARLYSYIMHRARNYHHAIFMLQNCWRNPWNSRQKTKYSGLGGSLRSPFPVVIRRIVRQMGSCINVGHDFFVTAVIRSMVNQV